MRSTKGFGEWVIVGILNVKGVTISIVGVLKWVLAKLEACVTSLSGERVAGGLLFLRIGT